jgi:hypothetical protein
MKARTAIRTPIEEGRHCIMCLADPSMAISATTPAPRLIRSMARVPRSLHPTNPSSSFLDRWFAFDSLTNAVAPLYLKPELKVEFDFSQCAWESLYSPITPVHQSISLLWLDLWRTGTNNGCPILWDDPEFTVSHTAPNSQPPPPDYLDHHQYHLSHSLLEIYNDPRHTSGMNTGGGVATTWLATPITTTWGLARCSHHSTPQSTTWGVIS